MKIIENGPDNMPQTVINYYGATYHVEHINLTIHGGTFNLADLPRKIPEAAHSSRVRPALEQLFSEGVVTEAKQWYAIYCVLSQCAGMPKDMPRFCQEIAAMELDLTPACVYNNWRRMQNELPFLPKNVKMWNTNDAKVNTNDKEEKARKQIAVASRLLEILGEQ